MIDIIVPVEGEGTQATVRTWLKKVGDPVVEHEPLVELETDKVAMEVPAPASGVLREILLDVNAEAAPGALLGRLASNGETVTIEEGPAGESIEVTSAPAQAGAVDAPGPELRPAPEHDAIREMRLSPRSSAPASSTISIRAVSRGPAATAASLVPTSIR
jgi:2-oxoglutarate dehydrogenase E2 component (dihydrolipoamide succinyltransferase)